MPKSAADEHHHPRSASRGHSTAANVAQVRSELAWLTAVAIAADLTAWLRLLALPETLRSCEPKALRYRFLRIPARLTRGARQRRLRLPRSWPWVGAAVATFTNVLAIPAPT